MGQARMDEKPTAEVELRPGPEPETVGSSNHDLARLAAAGDNVATGKLLRALTPRLVRVVRAVLGGSHPDADDAIQQALIGFVQALPAFRGDCDPLGYATVIAVRAAVAMRKRVHIDHARRDDQADADATPAARLSPGDEAASQQRKDILRDLLAELPPEQAEALAMQARPRLVAHEEIAAHSGARRLNTACVAVSAFAKEGMRRRIEENPSLVEALEVRS